MIILENIQKRKAAERYDLLWEMLKERTPAQSISHTEMPTEADHKRFVDNHPYSAWYFIVDTDNRDRVCGAIYLTDRREIGIHVFELYRNQGIASAALLELFRLHKGPFLANINPENYGSMRLFEAHGFKHIQNTLKLGADDAASR